MAETFGDQPVGLKGAATSLYSGQLHDNSFGANQPELAFKQQDAYASFNEPQE